MKNKRMIILLALLVTFLGAPSARAEKMMMHPMKGTMMGSMAEGMHGYWKKGKMSLEKKYLKKVKIILAHEEELGLTEDQKNQIVDKKMTLKKDLIKKNADIDTIAIDIKQEMGKNEINLANVNKLIDQKYDIKKQKAKAIVAAYDDLKKVLTADQSAQLKKIYKSGKKCPMGMDGCLHEGKMSREMMEGQKPMEGMMSDKDMPMEGMMQDEGMPMKGMMQ